MTIKLSFHFFRTGNTEGLIKFYVLLGFTIKEKKPESTTIEYILNDDRIIAEVIPSSLPEPGFEKKRIVIRVQNIEEIISKLKTEGFDLFASPYRNKWENSALLKDPDGRTIEISEIEIKSVI